MADYWHKSWACPYFVWDDKIKIGCEGSIVIKFPSPEALCTYADEFCTRADNFHKCPLAARLGKNYGGNFNDEVTDGRED